MEYPTLVLKPGRDVHLKNRHHAIFETAVQTFPKVEDGALVEVQSADRKFLCYATLNRKAYICGRAMAFEKGDPLKEIAANIERAVKLRATFREPTTNAYRLINAEGDGIPGLVVDDYAGVLVVQITTLGMDKLRSWITEQLKTIAKPKAIFEKSTATARKKEGLGDIEGWLDGKGPEVIDIMERGLKYKISLSGGQKTGFFLDQREMRSLVRNAAKGRTVLDICSYVGGFSVSAIAGGAKSSDAIDYDSAAIARAKEHVALNGLEPKSLGTSVEDAFNFLKRKPMPKKYDFIILDPPAFAKRSSDIEKANYAYTDLNRMAMEILPPGGLLLTCSCSYQMNPELFQTLVFHAAKQAKRSVRILSRHRQAFDHPVSLAHPEGDYLKSLFLAVD